MAEKTTKTDQPIRIFRAVVLVLMGAALGYFLYTTSVDSSSRYPFKFGLDLAGGSHLVYRADTSGVQPEEVDGAMAVLRDVIERRTNTFGVAEPLVQIEQGSVVAGAGNEQRLVVELPGVTDINEAVRKIGETPLLEFKLVNAEAYAATQALDALASTTDNASSSNMSVNDETADGVYIDTGLTGRYLARASLQFGSTQQGQLANDPIVQLEFNEEGAELFEKITTEHVGETLAIFLDGAVVSAPQINEPISGGTAIISGQFTPDEARELVHNLNFGALPVPIALVSTEVVGATLGERALDAGVQGSFIGLLFVGLFMTFWYRLPGFAATLSLLFYVLIMLAIFKLIPVTITAAGLAGLILSLGLAVDANILISERLKEELDEGKSPQDAIAEGFRRAWTSIRDGNLVNIFSGVILYWFGDVFIEGFAFTLVIGTLVSLTCAIVVSRTLLLAVVFAEESKMGRFLLRNGFKK